MINYAHQIKGEYPLWKYIVQLTTVEVDYDCSILWDQGLRVICIYTYRDALYTNSTRVYRLDAEDDSFFIMCGVNHVTTGKATYTNFAVGNVISVDDSMFGGSARRYAPNIPDVDMFCKTSDHSYSN